MEVGSVGFLIYSVILVVFSVGVFGYLCATDAPIGLRAFMAGIFVFSLNMARVGAIKYRNRM